LHACARGCGWTDRPQIAAPGQQRFLPRDFFFRDTVTFARARSTTGAVETLKAFGFHWPTWPSSILSLDNEQVLHCATIKRLCSTRVLAPSERRRTQSMRCCLFGVHQVKGFSEWPRPTWPPPPPRPTTPRLAHQAHLPWRQRSQSDPRPTPTHQKWRACGQSRITTC
jgi:hypothetical protein